MKLVVGLHNGYPSSDKEVSWGGEVSNGASLQKPQLGQASDGISVLKSGDSKANVEASLHGLLYMCELVNDRFHKRNK